MEEEEEEVVVVEGGMMVVMVQEEEEEEEGGGEEEEIGGQRTLQEEEEEEEEEEGGEVRGVDVEEGGTERKSFEERCESIVHGLFCAAHFFFLSSGTHPERERREVEERKRWML
jgi:hypothetical protein